MAALSTIAIVGGALAGLAYSKNQADKAQKAAGDARNEQMRLQKEQQDELDRIEKEDEAKKKSLKASAKVRSGSGAGSSSTGSFLGGLSTDQSGKVKTLLGE